jgi:hypothetical protein
MKKILLVLIALAAVQYAYSGWGHSGVTAYSKWEMSSNLTTSIEGFNVLGNPRIFTIRYDMCSSYTNGWFQPSHAWAWMKFNFIGVNNYEEVTIYYSSDEDGGTLKDEINYPVPENEIVWGVDLQTHADVDPRHIHVHYCTCNLNVLW